MSLHWQAGEWLKGVVGYASDSYLHLKSFEQDLESFKADPSKYNLNGDPPLHALVRIVVTEDSREKKQKLMVLLLRVIHLYVNLRNKHGLTALHVAAQLHDIDSVKTLLVFGADSNALTLQNKTPLDLIEAPPLQHERKLKHAGSSRDLETSMAKISATDTVNSFEIERVLELFGGRSSKNCRQISEGIYCTFRRNSRLCSSNSEYNTMSEVDPSDYMAQLANHFYSSESKVQEILAASMSPSHEFSSDEALALSEEMKKTQILKGGGSRILVLDGGGMGGLIQIEVLLQLEKETGKYTSELFDWVIATSAGSFVAAGIATGWSLTAIRRLCYESMERWFSQGLLGLTVDTDAMERDFKSWFGDKLMSSIKHPNLLVSAVKKSTSPIQLHIFNNCFGDEFSSQPIWKVCRYSSSAPAVILEKDDYVDGGVLANNPSECGLTRIQSHYKQRGEKLPISLVVSIGSGLLPPTKLGSVDLLDFKNFAQHFANRDLGERVKSLGSVVFNAIVQTETSAANTKSRCEEQYVPFHRFNVNLDADIGLVETNMLKLIQMLVDVRKQILTTPEFSELVKQLRKYPAAKQRAVELLHAY